MDDDDGDGDLYGIWAGVTAKKRGDREPFCRNPSLASRPDGAQQGIRNPHGRRAARGMSATPCRLKLVLKGATDPFVPPDLEVDASGIVKFRGVGFVVDVNASLTIADATA